MMSCSLSMPESSPRFSRPHRLAPIPGATNARQNGDTRHFSRAPMVACCPRGRAHSILVAATLLWALSDLFLLSCPALGSDWPRWRGPSLNGVSTEQGWTALWPPQGPRQLWKISVGTGFSSVSVSRGLVYTMGNQNDTDTVYCLDESTGNILWKHSYPCPLDSKY